MAEVLALAPNFERFPAREKKFAETVVIVHHLGGNKHSFKRHAEWLNELGFDVVTFDLPYKGFSDIRSGLPISKDWQFGMRHVWADKIENVLSHLPQNKFVISFSMPSVAALRAIARRHAIDVKGWICEGGPFLQLTKAQENLFRHHLLKDSPKIMERPLIYGALAKLSGIAIGYMNFERDGRKNFAALPKGFPILSLRAGRDILVSPTMIDDYLFMGLPHIDLERSLFSSSEHLTAFRDERDLYERVVGGFLKRLGTSI